MERNPEQSHGGAMGFTPPAGVQLQYISRSTNLGELLVKGELDALLLFISAQNLVDRSTNDPLASPSVKRLFQAPLAEAHRYYAKTHIYPINHCVVVRRSIAEKHPWVVLNIFNAFQRAKEG